MHLSPGQGRKMISLRRVSGFLVFLRVLCVKAFGVCRASLSACPEIDVI
jgi:hypothetical protein